MRSIRRYKSDEIASATISEKAVVATVPWSRVRICFVSATETVTEAIGTKNQDTNFTVVDVRRESLTEDIIQFKTSPNHTTKT